MVSPNQKKKGEKIMMNFVTDGSFQEKCSALRALRMEVQSFRNTLIRDIIEQMEIGKPYTVAELNKMSNVEMSTEMISGAFRSLANFTEGSDFSFDFRYHPSSLRSYIGSGRIACGQPIYKRTFFVECDEQGNVIPGGKRTCQSHPLCTYVRQK